MASSAMIFGNRCRALMAAAKSAAASSATVAAKPRVVARNTGILKVYMVSPALAEFIGSPETSRSGAVKKIWEYVKSHNLQAHKSELCTLLFNDTIQTFNQCTAKFFRFMLIIPDHGGVLLVLYKNSANKREIYCDDKLKTIFDCKDKVNFQEVAKLLSNHFPKSA